MRIRLICPLLTFFFTFRGSFIITAGEPSYLETPIQKIGQFSSIRLDYLENHNKMINQWLTEEMDFGDFDIPKLLIKGFSDLGFVSTITENHSGSSFALGVVDFFITSEISDKTAFLTEMGFHPDSDDNVLHFHIERANLRYSISDILSIKIGRIHTPLGYWNQSYHHGSWLQTTILRPEIYLWEDDGGILPVHSVGIELFGMKQFNRFDLEYYFDVVNGRGRTISEIQNIEDKNGAKAVNALFTLKPHFMTSLNFGLNIFVDRIPENPVDSSRASEIDEIIYGGYITYFGNKIELIGEFFSITHDDETSNNIFNTLGLYLQGGYHINDLTGYYRFDLIDFGVGDPYFNFLNNNFRKHTLGIKWDISSWNALKIEYGFREGKDQNDEHSFRLNSSFAF